MRIALLALAIALALFGPAWYAIMGGKARAERRDRLRALAAERAQIAELLAADAPPQLPALEAARRELAAARSIVERFQSAVAPAAAAPGDAELRALAEAGGIAAGVVEPTLAGMSADAVGTLRRRGLAAALRAVGGDPAVRVLSLRVAPEPSKADPALCVRLIGVQLELAGDPAALLRCLHRLLAAEGAPGDLARAELRPAPELEWDQLPAGSSGPPVRLSLHADLIAGAAP